MHGCVDDAVCVILCEVLCDGASCDEGSCKLKLLILSCLGFLVMVTDGQ